MDDVVFFGIIWLFVAFVAAGMIEIQDLNFTQTMARTIFWPLIAPILVIKGLMLLGKFALNVLKETPDALGDIWRWR